MLSIRLPLYVCLVALVCARDIYHSTENLDMFCYIASAEAARGADNNQIFSTVANQLRIARSDQRKVLLASDYGRNLLSNPSHLVLAIPFYSTKPLYVALVRGLLYLTKSYSLATFLPTVIGYIGITAIIWLMVGRHNFILAMLIAIQPALVNAVQLRTPDLLSIFCLMAGLFLCAEQRSTAGITLMLTSLWIRPDLAVYVACFAVVLYLSKKIDGWQLAMTVALGIATSAIIRSFSYPWSTLFYNSFVTPMLDPSAVQVHVAPTLYIHTAFHALIEIWGTFGGLLLLLTFLAALYRTGRVLLSACVVGTALHFLIFPSTEERFYLPLFLVASIFAAQGVATAEIKRFRRPESDRIFHGATGQVA